jgi:hypothetical protein
LSDKKKQSPAFLDFEKNSTARPINAPFRALGSNAANASAPRIVAP